MTYTSVRNERLILMNPNNRHAAQKVTAWDRIVATLTDPDLIALVMFCAIGLLVTFALILTFPRFGQIAEALQQLV